MSVEDSFPGCGCRGRGGCRGHGGGRSLGGSRSLCQSLADGLSGKRYRPCFPRVCHCDRGRGWKCSVEHCRNCRDNHRCWDKY